MPTQEFCNKLMNGSVKHHTKSIAEMSDMEKKVHFTRTKREQTANSFGEE